VPQKKEKIIRGGNKMEAQLNEKETEFLKRAQEIWNRSRKFFPHPLLDMDRIAYDDIAALAKSMGLELIGPILVEKDAIKMQIKEST
jgi:hypothetical protein